MSKSGGDLVEIRYREQLQYTEATLLEIQRFAVIVPFTLERFASQDTMVNGTLLKKGLIKEIHLTFARKKY